MSVCWTQELHPHGCGRRENTTQTRLNAILWRAGEGSNPIQRGAIIFCMLSDQRQQFELITWQFIRNELETGITFAHLALDKNTEEGRQRNRQNGRKAYETAKHLLKEHPLEEPSVQHYLLTRMTTLKGLLLQLGETFA